MRVPAGRASLVYDRRFQWCNRRPQRCTRAPRPERQAEGDANGLGAALVHQALGVFVPVGVPVGANHAPRPVPLRPFAMAEGPIERQGSHALATPRRARLCSISGLAVLSVTRPIAASIGAVALAQSRPSKQAASTPPLLVTVMVPPSG